MHASGKPQNLLAAYLQRNGGRKFTESLSALRYDGAMAKYPDDRPLFSLLLQVASPALIIAMVASLIFFLIEIFYRGPHVIRLNSIMALFTIATVLISRISIEAGKERAAMFAAGLALATLATTSVVVEFEYQDLALLEPVVIIILIVIVMWVSNRLVWDCTLLGRTRDVSAMGLLEAIRQKLSPRLTPPADQTESLKAKKFRKSESFSFFEFMLGRNGKNTTPGLWVFYLAIAAFPIFGVGQWFVNPNSSGFSIFFLFAVYLTSGLGLLMVTSLLGLKRYANKRGVSIPEPVAMNWLFVGTMFLIGLLLLISLLPRPDLSSRMNDYLVLLGSNEKTSELAIGGDNDLPEQAEEDQNAKAKLKPQAEPNNEPNNEQRPSDDAPVADGDRGDQTDQKSSEKTDGGGGQKSDSQSGDREKGNGNDAQTQQARQRDGDQNDKGERENREKDDPGENADENASADAEKNRDDGEADKPQGEPKPNDNPDQQRNGQPNEFAKMQRPVAPPPRLSLQPDSNSFRWIFYSLVGLILATIAIMYHAELLRMWRQLFAVKRPRDEDETEDVSSGDRHLAPPKPFSSFTDPFVSGMARKVRPEKLMEYSINALRAWSNDHGIDVSQHSTIDDLVAAIERSLGKSQSNLRSFAVTFNQTIYGDRAPNSPELQTVSDVWRFMKKNHSANESQKPSKSAVRI